MDYDKKHNGLIGLIVVIVILVGIGFGVFYLFRNKENLDINLPWEDNSPRAKKKEQEEDEIDEALKLGKLDTQNQTPCNFNLLFALNNLQKDDKGYTFDFYAEKRDPNMQFDIDVFKLLVDNYDTSSTASLQVHGNDKYKTTVRILQTDLDSQEIERFNNLSLYINLTETTPDSVTERECLLTASVNHQIAVNNEKKGLQFIDEKDLTSISYYNLTEDKDNHYIYFLLNNKRTSSASSIYIKKLVINDKIYPLPDFKEDIYKGARKAFYIKVPKKDFKTIDKFTVSFFIESKVEKASAEKKDTGYYISNEFTKTFANES